MKTKHVKQLHTDTACYFRSCSALKQCRPVAPQQRKMFVFHSLSPNCIQASLFQMHLFINHPNKSVAADERMRPTRFPLLKTGERCSQCAMLRVCLHVKVFGFALQLGPGAVSPQSQKNSFSVANMSHFTHKSTSAVNFRGLRFRWN